MPLFVGKNTGIRRVSGRGFKGDSDYRETIKVSGEGGGQGSNPNRRRRSSL